MYTVFKALPLHISELLRSQRLQVKQEIPYEYCNEGSSDFISDFTIDNITPYPIQFVSGNRIDITTNFDLIRAIEPGSIIEMKWTKLGIIDIPFPCIDVSTYRFPSISHGDCVPEQSKIF